VRDRPSHYSTYVALEDESNDHLGGNGLSLNSGRVESPILDGDDCLFRESRDAANHTNFYGTASLAHGYVDNHGPLGDAICWIVCERRHTDLGRYEL
jgi:hypothetical protein